MTPSQTTDYNSFMFFVAFSLSFFLLVITAPSTVIALERHIHAGAGGTSPQELPLIVAKDLGIFEKYGLEVDLVVIGGGSRLMQALIGRSFDSANVAAMAPIRANLSGANVVVTGAFLKQEPLQVRRAQRDAQTLGLRSKKLGIVNFGGAVDPQAKNFLAAWGDNYK